LHCTTATPGNKTDETIEEFAERIEDMVAEGYEFMPDYFINSVAMDSLLRGCIEEQAALLTLNKDPKTLNEVMQYVKDANANQKLIGGVRKEI
jgi:hypothetical protein